jgi:hypothetical protein
LKRHITDSTRKDHSDIAKLLNLSTSEEQTLDAKKPRFEANTSCFTDWDQDGELTSKIDEMIAEMIASDGLPLSFVDKPGFRRLMNFVLPEYKLKKRTSFTDKILPRVYSKMQSSVKAKLASVPFFSVTLDTWSSPQNNHSLLSITGHFLDENMNAGCVILGAKPIKGSHTAANLKTIADNVMREYEIADGKIHMITRDAANTMKKMAKDMHLGSFDCFAHKLDLAVKAGLKNAASSFDGVVEKVKKFVRKIRKSGNDSRLFKELQNNLDLPVTVLIKDIAVRWNSTYKMLVRFLANRSAIEAFILECDKPETYPKFSEGDWKLIQTIANDLEPIAEQYELLQSRKTSVAFVWPVYKMIKYFLEKSGSSLCKQIGEQLEMQMGKCKLNL